MKYFPERGVNPMKKLITVCLIAAAILGSTPVTALRVQAVKTTRTEDGWVLKKTELYVTASYAGKAKKVTVPNGVQKLNSLPNCVREIHISDSVEECDILWGGSKNLRKYTVSKKNKNYSAKDGVLFDKKKKTLVHYPPKKEGRKYNVPQGVKEIDLIENNNLKNLKLPDSLLRISTIRSKKMAKLRIPPKVYSIGVVEIAGKITIAEGNKTYTMSEGVTINKKTSELIFYPPNKKDETYTLPDGVKYIYSNAFANNRCLKTLHIPKTFNWAYDAYDFISPFYELSTPYLRNYTVDPDNSNFTAQDGVLYNKEMTELYAYPGGKRSKTYIMPETMNSGFNLSRNKYLRDVTVNAVAFIQNENDYKTYKRPDWWWLDIYFPPNLQNVYVNKDNPMFSSDNGVLLNKNMTELIYYPEGRTASSYTVPESVTRIRDHAFWSVKKKLTVKLPPNVKSVADLNYRKIIAELDSDDDNSDYNKIARDNLKRAYKKITFKVKKDSVSHRTVKKLGLNYKFY